LRAAERGKILTGAGASFEEPLAGAEESLAGAEESLTGAGQQLRPVPSKKIADKTAISPRLMMLLHGLQGSELGLCQAVERLFFRTNERFLDETLKCDIGLRDQSVSRGMPKRNHVLATRACQNKTRFKYAPYWIFWGRGKGSFSQERKGAYF
jgi:hypothetical protein